MLPQARLALATLVLRERRCRATWRQKSALPPSIAAQTIRCHNEVCHRPQRSDGANRERRRETPEAATPFPPCCASWPTRGSDAVCEAPTDRAGSASFASSPAGTTTEGAPRHDTALCRYACRGSTPDRPRAIESSTALLSPKACRCRTVLGALAALEDCRSTVTPPSFRAFAWNFSH